MEVAIIEAVAWAQHSFAPSTDKSVHFLADRSID